jgi:hypothetical protein
LLSALLGRISAFHRFAQCSDGQFARLVDRYLSAPTDRHPLPDSVTISVVDEVRATSAWLDEDAEPLQFTAPDRELVLPRLRSFPCVALSDDHIAAESYWRQPSARPLRTNHSPRSISPTVYDVTVRLY